MKQGEQVAAPLYTFQVVGTFSRNKNFAERDHSRFARREQWNNKQTLARALPRRTNIGAERTRSVFRCGTLSGARNTAIV
jgi:hypothetical protein